jgi:hypothetical protein
MEIGITGGLQDVVKLFRRYSLMAVCQALRTFLGNDQPRITIAPDLFG